MAEGGLKPPGHLSSFAGGWEKWLMQYDFYMKATEKDKKPKEVQVTTLLTLLGPEGIEV